MIKVWNNHYGKVVAEKDQHYIIDCEPCGFKHAIPLPDEKEQADFYEHSFYENYWGNYIRNHLEESEWYKIEYNEKYDLFKKFLPSPVQQTLLDIGSGPGLFLKAGCDRGWTTVGVEPGRAAWKYSTSKLALNVHNVFFNEETHTQFGTFQVVHINNVLEHLLHPQNTLLCIHDILEPDGLISVSVPNDFNPLQKAVIDYYKKDMWWVDIREHVNYFDRDSLDNLLIKTGFRPIYHTSSFPLELFILLGEDYIGNNKIGREIHNKRKKFDCAMEKSGNTNLKRKIYNKLSEIGLGREITVIGKKQTMASSL